MESYLVLCTYEASGRSSCRFTWSRTSP